MRRRQRAARPERGSHAVGRRPRAGSLPTRGARETWLAVLQSEFEAFREKAIIAERFGGEEPWLDPYGATSIDEFFAVACEAYFVNRARFASEFGALLSLFDSFFAPSRISGEARS